MSGTAFELKPQVNVSRSTSARMWLVFCCAFIAVIQSSIGDSGESFFIAFSALISAIITELLVTRKEYGFAKIKDGSAAATALVFALLLPNQIHPVYAALGAAFAIAVVKRSFGGLGSNWMNPALGGWLFVRFSWPEAFGTALERALENVPGAATPAGSAIGGFLNRAVFWFFGAELPPPYIDLFSLQTPGIIADRAALALVITTAVIAASQISRSWMSLVFLAVYGLLVRMAGDLHAEGLWWNGDVFFALLSGGTLVTAFILIADPSSGAKSAAGSVLTAVLAAVLSFAFRYIGGAFYGCFFAVALINALTPLLCKFEKKLFYSRPPVSVSAGGKR
jgi:electron transport complex protein RnfD